MPPVSNRGAGNLRPAAVAASTVTGCAYRRGGGDVESRSRPLDSVVRSRLPSRGRAAASAAALSWHGFATRASRYAATHCPVLGAIQQERSDRTACNTGLVRMVGSLGRCALAELTGVPINR